MRILDGKFHLDGERIVKTSNGEEIPEDEPVFLLRARDLLALPTLRKYLDLCLEDGTTAYQQKATITQIRRFSDWAKENPSRMKQPGITQGR